MKFTCGRDVLTEALGIVQRAIPGKSNVPVLEGILIEVSEDVVLTGSDNDISISYQIEAIIEEIGSVVVSSKTFGDIVRKLPDIYVTVETAEDGSKLIINSGSAHFEINLLNRTAYPKINYIESNDVLTLSQKNLRTLIRQTSFAASQDNARPILRGVLAEQKNNMLTFVAIDGFRLALKYIESNFEKNFSIVIPARVLNEMSRIIDKDDENINICFNDNQIMFFTNNFKVISSLLKGEYFNYQKMIPADFVSTIELDTKALVGGIERVSLVLEDERKWPIDIKTYADEIVINVAGERGVSREVISSEVSGQEIEISFNSKNIGECLRAVETEKITVKFSSEKGPAIICSPEDSSFTFLVMPVKPRLR